MPRQLSNVELTPHITGVVDYNQFRFGTRPIEASNREFPDDLEYEAFMQEPLVIHIHSAPDANAPRAVYLGDNGEKVWLPRNAKVRLPRRFVEILARSTQETFTTQQVRDPNADDQMQVTSHTAPCYGFSVLHDPSPAKGHQWLERVTRQGC